MMHIGAIVQTPLRVSTRQLEVAGRSEPPACQTNAVDPLNDEKIGLKRALARRTPIASMNLAQRLQEASEHVDLTQA